ncbi:MAG: type II CRISPR RNA-guided endonuclease Cas9 [Proteobacteria bacterium]|nr:type II CRISPR RNA-guided endonuclease Cas9 [Pseudomonadota bacterium]
MQNNSQISYRLGLDLGTNSIGWAMLALNQNNEPCKILDAGVRIFSDGRNPKDGTPLAVARREARGMRRRRDRFLTRKSQLMNCLIKLGLMPKDEIERKKLELLNPYQIRAKALDEALNPFELGRAIFHLNQRRGFKSNRKERVTDYKKLSETKRNQENLANKISETNSRTLGEFFYRERILKELTARAKPDESGLYPTRVMYENEFNEIKKVQFQNQKLSEENWQKIKEIIFHQRPLAPQEKGVCQFINKFKSLPNWAAEIFENYQKLSERNKNSKGLPRAYLALPSYQKFRILSEINNLKIIRNNREEILLDAAQKRKLIEYLHENKSAKFSSLRKQIGYGAEEFQFNFEGGKRDKLQGNETEIFLKDKKFGEKWHNFSLQKQDEIVEFLLDTENEEAIHQKALQEWNCNEEQALEIKKITPNNFKSGVGNLSKEFLQKIVAEIAEKNCRYDEATENLGFHHSKKEFGEIQSQLDYYGKAIPASTVPVKSGSEEEVFYGRIANPTVHVAPNQVRKVVNSIIKENGSPSEIHIELARDLKISQKEKDEIESQQKKNEKENEYLRKELENLNQRNTYGNRLKLKLWKELNPNDCNDRKCPFCGTQIGVNKISSHEIEIEHILPFSKTYDDSIANKTLAHRNCNQKKGNLSPFEAFGDSTFERIQNLPKNKKWRFYENAMEKFSDESGFQERQLNDTRYLSKIAHQYLAQICDPNKIKVANGKLTSLLRHHWGLNSILNKETERPLDQQNPEIENLREATFDSETDEVFESKSQEKNKKQKPKNRDDHRHHAVDAIVIAMTETKLLQQISRDNAIGHDLDRLIINVPNHWNRFREDVVEAIEKIVVSHKVDQSANSELHSQTSYGVLKKKIADEDSKKQSFNVVFSKSGGITSLNKNEIERIRDKKIRNNLMELTKDISKSKSDEKRLLSILQQFSRESGVKNIRILDKIQTAVKIEHGKNNQFSKAISPDNKSHISLWQMPNGGIITDVVSSLRMTSIYEIIERDGMCLINKSKKFPQDQVYEKLKPHPAAKLIIRLFKDDMVRLEKNGETLTAKITSVPDSTQCSYALHTSFSSNKEAKGTFYLNKNTLVDKKLRKIFVSPSGKVFDSGPILKTTKEN